MTDSKGTLHPWTNLSPPPAEIAHQKSLAKQSLPPQFAELVNLTDHPFIQAITDVLSPQAVFYQGRVVLVGDALAGFRPHTAGSTSQAAFHALKLFEYLGGNERDGKSRETRGAGRWDWEGYEREVLEYARRGVEHGIELGNRSQFQEHRGYSFGGG
jgi:2-polyprenyl-6-methoxyphenol hydroxylase-like FAD-dependent oxidoreductase